MAEMAIEAAKKALAEAEALFAALKQYDDSPAQKMALLKKTDAIRAALEEPYDTAMRWLENLSTAGALYILLRIKAFEKLPATGSITAAELAKQCNADVSIVTRSMRMLLSNGIATETEPDTYANNGLSLAFQPKAFGCLVCVSVDFMKTYGAIPDYVKTHEPEELYDAKKSPFAYAAGHEGKNYYEVLELDPDQRHLWNLMLQGMAQNFPILGMFPFSSLETQVKEEPDRPFVVDVGGGRGQALMAIQEECKDAFTGRLILQDLPIVINTLEESEIPGIEAMKYDIFTPQPVKNAHIYLMRRLLHDFYDPVCVDFVRNTAAAMGPTSRLLICDMLVPDRVEVGGSMDLYWLDLSLLTIGGKERKLADFEFIFEAAGLELVQVYKSGIGHTVMLEAKLK